MPDNEPLESFGRNPDQIPAAEVLVNERSVFLLRLGGSLFGIPDKVVENVDLVQAPVPIPTAPAHFLGALPVRGRILTVVDIHAILHLPPIEEPEDAEATQRRLVVLSVDTVPFAILVDEVLGLRQISDRDLLPDAGESATDSHSILGAMVQISEGIFVMLRPEVLLERLLARTALAQEGTAQ